MKAAFGLDRTLPVFVVAVVRGSIDTVINAVVLLTAGVLILVFAVPPLLGFAGLDGMLRRTLYTSEMYEPHMVVAMIGGIGIVIGFLSLLLNLVLTLGVGNIFQVILPSKT